MEFINKAYCDICGRPYKANELTVNYKGLAVCNDDYEDRHPQEFIKTPVESSKPSLIRPDPNSGETLLNEPLTVYNDTGNWYNNGEEIN